MESDPPQFIPFKENTSLTGPGAQFAIPLTYKGRAVYFGSLEQVNVPPSLQADLAHELSKSLNAGKFTQSSNGDTEVGRITVTDGDRKREFEIAMTLTKTGGDDYYLVQSILEVSG